MVGEEAGFDRFSLDLNRLPPVEEADPKGLLSEWLGIRHLDGLDETSPERFTLTCVVGYETYTDRFPSEWLEMRQTLTCSHPRCLG